MMLNSGSTRWKVFTSLPVVLIILTVILAACGGGSTTTNPSKYNGNISVGVDSDIITLDPLKSTALIDRQVMLNIYDTLVRVDEHNAILPDLATSWSYTSSDNTKLVFTLRTDVNFQDGTPFNADAVVFNINRILNAPTSPRFSELVTALRTCNSISRSHLHRCWQT